jgi:hypothetical protein
MESIIVASVSVDALEVTMIPPAGKQTSVTLLSACSLDRMPTNFTRLAKMLAVLTEMLLPGPRLLAEKWRAQILILRDIKFSNSYLVHY